MRDGRALVYCAGGGIGDSLIATLVARALRQRYRGVDALTLPGHQSTLRHVGDIDEVLVDGGGDEREAAAMLAERGYAACVVTWATARTAKIPYLAKIPVRVGQSRRLYSWQFTKRVSVRSEQGNATSHWSDIQLDYARTLGCDLHVDERIPSFVVTDEDERDVDVAIRAVLRDASNGAPQDDRERGVLRYIVLHPTNATAVERGMWPVGGWSELVRALCEQFGVPVFLTGTDADRAILDAIINESSNAASSPKAISFAGKLSIGGFGALAKRAMMVVGMGTGTLHVAGAVGAPTVALFPMQSDFPERWRPLGERVRVVRASYPCHPGDTKETCVDYACIANLPVKAILATVSELLV